MNTPSNPHHSADNPLEKLQGSIERVTFHSESSGFCVLRVKVKDKALVMPDTDWKQKTGANGVVQVADGVQIIYGAKADIYKNNLKSALNMD